MEHQKLQYLAIPELTTRLVELDLFIQNAGQA